VALAGADRMFQPASLRGLPAALTLAGLIFAGTGLYWACAHLLGAPEPAELKAVAWRRRAGGGR
jgi:hypothetical protein